MPTDIAPSVDWLVHLSLGFSSGGLPEATALAVCINEHINCVQKAANERDEAVAALAAANEYNAQLIARVNEEASARSAAESALAALQNEFNNFRNAHSGDPVPVNISLQAELDSVRAELGTRNQQVAELTAAIERLRNDLPPQ